MIAVLTNPSAGGTFLTWSVHYLRGDDQYFLVEDNSYHSVVDNPLTKNNAHKFIPNQPNRGPTQNLESLYQIVNKLKEVDNDGVVYLHNFNHQADNSIGVEYLSTNADKTILMSTKNLSLYHVGYNPRSGNWISNTEYTIDPDVIYNSLIQNYFLESNNVWQNLQLTNVWDQREFIALNFNFTNVDNIDNYFNHSIDHYHLEAVELYNLSSYIKHVFDYLELPIDKPRYDSWLPVYQTWQEVHKSRLLFAWYFSEIIDYIISGHNLDLTRFNLDILQEAAIQQFLIFNHDLNLKTWQLEKFTNTKQLHQLLEPNIHNTSDYKHLHQFQ